MAQNKLQLVTQAIKILEKDQTIVFIEDLICELPIGKTTFYGKKLNEVNDIKNLLEENKTLEKRKMRKKWMQSDNPTLQLAYYKLIANKEEYERLNTQKYDHTSKGESVKPIEIIVQSREQAEKLKKFFEHGRSIN